VAHGRIVKIDTEDSEVDILAGMTSLDFDAIMLEYHSEANPANDRCTLQDYIGKLKFVHKRLIEAAGRSSP
jgi:hypothetical protein